MIGITIDTREQKPWSFPEDRFMVTRGTLSTGDYCLTGVDGFCVERKSLGDFVGTVIGDWIRFRKELIRMAAMDYAVIVVECSVDDVIEHRYESEAKPQSVLGRAHGIFADHGVPVLWWGQRQVCEPIVWQFFELMHKKLR